MCTEFKEQFFLFSKIFDKGCEIYFRKSRATVAKGRKDTLTEEGAYPLPSMHKRDRTVTFD